MRLGALIHVHEVEFHQERPHPLLAQDLRGSEATLFLLKRLEAQLELSVPLSVASEPLYEGPLDLVAARRAGVREMLQTHRLLPRLARS